MQLRCSSLACSAAVWLLMCVSLPAVCGETPEIVSVKKIWGQAPHSAFTDLARYRDRWFCTFREAPAHMTPKGDGVIRVLESIDGDAWTSAAVIAESGVDLRDPKFSIMPDGRLMIVCGGSVYADPTVKDFALIQPRVVFSTDGRQWTTPERVLNKGQWLWRVTWHDGRAYGIVTQLSKRSPQGIEHDEPGTPLELVTSTDGLHWEPITKLEISQRPHESTVRFMPDGEMIALVRRNAGDGKGWIGTSRPPYKDWSWNVADYYLGGPNFIILPNGQMWCSGRSKANDKATTFLGPMTRKNFERTLTLPSGGDTSYAGMVMHDGLLWMSYYSSHEGKTSIYLAKIKLPESN